MMKFIASNLKAAKDKAHRALGAKAVIISVRELPSGDVEVTASDKPAPSAPSAAPAYSFANAARDAVDDGPLKLAAGTRLNQTMEHRFSEDALSQLSSRLTGSAPAPSFDMANAHVRAMTEVLTPHGVNEKLLAALIEGAQKSRIDEDLHRLQTAFDYAFTFAPLNFSPATPIMLIGPTGAGKTSCAAKLAAGVAQNGSPPLMMTADVGRAGAVEQIRSYSEALGAHYYIVESPLDVQQVLRTNRPKGAVILDTPGVSPYDSGDVSALRSYKEACAAEPVLVLPAGGDAAEYKDWAHAFKEIGVRCCILTKFDAAKRVGAGLCAAFEGGIALAHFSETPFISEGLVTANADFLARRLIASHPGRIC